MSQRKMSPAQVLALLASLGVEVPPPTAKAGAPCPRCGCEQTTPTGDGNAIGLCGHVWKVANSA